MAFMFFVFLKILEVKKNYFSCWKEADERKKFKVYLLLVKLLFSRQDKENKDKNLGIINC